jgi:hypothetical protein
VRRISNRHETVPLPQHYIPSSSPCTFSSLFFPKPNFFIVSPIPHPQAALVEIPAIPPTTPTPRSSLIAARPCSPWGLPELSAEENGYDGRIIREEKDDDFGDDVLPYEDKSFIMAARLSTLGAGSV